MAYQEEESLESWLSECLIQFNVFSNVFYNLDMLHGIVCLGLGRCRSCQLAARIFYPE